MRQFLQRLIQLAAGLVLAAAGAAAATPAAPLPAPLSLPGIEQLQPWYNGSFINIGTDVYCDIFGPPVVETRVMGYAGFSHPPPDFTPALGEVFYVHLVLGHPGNPCAGSAVGIELILPPGMETANSPGNIAYCFMARGTPLVLYDLDADPDYGCPQSYPQGLQGLAVRAVRGGIGGGAWGMHRGFWLELLIPVRATQVQNGSNAIAWRVNPDVGVVGYPQVGAFANGEVIFRDGMETNDLRLDLCTLNPAPQGC